MALYPNREDLQREYPELEEDDIKEALAYAAANLDDKVLELESGSEQSPRSSSSRPTAEMGLAAGSCTWAPRQRLVAHAHFVVVLQEATHRGIAGDRHFESAGLQHDVA